MNIGGPIKRRQFETAAEHDIAVAKLRAKRQILLIVVKINILLVIDL